MYLHCIFLHNLCSLTIPYHEWDVIRIDILANIDVFFWSLTGDFCHYCMYIEAPVIGNLWKSFSCPSSETYNSIIIYEYY